MGKQESYLNRVVDIMVSDTIFFEDNLKIPYIDDWHWKGDLPLYGEGITWEDYCRFFDYVADIFSISTVECHKIMDVYFNTLIKENNVEGQW